MIDNEIQSLKNKIDQIKNKPCPKFDDDLFKKILSVAHYETLSNLMTKDFQIVSINKFG